MRSILVGFGLSNARRRSLKRSLELAQLQNEEYVMFSLSFVQSTPALTPRI